MTTYPMIANACFTIEGTGGTVTVRGAPFNWRPEAPIDRDRQGVDAALGALSDEGLENGVTLALVWVETSPQST